MSLEAMVRDAASKASFFRGEDLVANAAVSSWKASPDAAKAGGVSVRGTVADRSKVLDGVFVSFDPASERISSHGCPCGTDKPGGDICKHVVALALTYLDARRSCGDGVSSSDEAAAGAQAASQAPATGKPPASAPDARAQRSGRGTAQPVPNAAPAGAADADEIVSRLKAQTQDLLARYKSEQDGAADTRRSGTIQEPQTSPQVSKIVYAYAEAHAAELAASEQPAAQAGAGDQEPDGLVDLAPTLVSSGRVPGSDGLADTCVWEVRLRIGTERAQYLVRQVDDLVKAWDSGARRSYGRNLAFAHTRAAFTDRANALLAIFSRIQHTQDASRAAGRTPYGAGASFGVNTKAFALSDRDAADLLDAMLGSEIQFEPRVPATSVRARPLTVAAGDPELAVDMAHGERGGFDLTLPAGADCVLTVDRMYLLLEDRAWRVSDAYRARMGAFCRASLPASAPLHIRETDMPGFCSTVLPAIKQGARVEVPDDLEVLLPPPAELTFRFALVRDVVTCDAQASYAGVALDIFEPVRPGQPLRDIVRERSAQALVRAFFSQMMPSPGSWYRARSSDAATARTANPWPAGEAPDGKPCFDAGNAGDLYRLITEGFERFSEMGSVLVSENLRSINVRPAPRVRVEASIKSGLLDIAIDSSDLSPHDLLAYLASFERKQRFVRLADGDIVRLDDGGVKAVAELAAGLGVSAQALVEGTEEIPMNRALFVDAMMKRSEGVRFDRDESFRSVIRDFDSIGDNDFVEPASLRDVLRPYQREGFKWISTLAKLGFGGILADDMGLGKTLQVIAFLLARHEAAEDLPNLVVCPASLVYNWTAELARFAPALSVAAVVGLKEERGALIQTARGYDVLVTSYELLKRDIELYEEQRFYCQVLDEAQYIKNHATQAARCVKRVGARVRLALTGTPIENRLSELWSIFDYLMPGLLGTYDAFHRRFENPIAAEEQTAAKRLQCMVGPFVLRRMKADVLKDLPEKNESVVYAHMSGEQEQLYRATANRLALELAHQLPSDFASQRIAILAELTKLRQICCDPSLLYDNFAGESAKLECALELVASAVDGGHKVLLFSQFTSMLKIIARRLDEAGVGHYELTGSTPKEERARLVAAFQTDDVPVFLISLKAGGVGLNLTAADIVIHYDPWWNLAAQNQATDRAHRIGQTNTVTVMRLIAKGSIEEKIVQLQEAKRDLAESIIGGEAVATTGFTREDILALLEP